VTSPRPSTVHYYDVVTQPGGKAGVDGNRGVKTRVYTRVTDVTTVGGDGENEVDVDKEEQRRDEPNIISEIIDQVPILPRVANICFSSVCNYLQIFVTCSFYIFVTFINVI
jgi:hypothetical protein